MKRGRGEVERVGRKKRKNTQNYKQLIPDEKKRLSGGPSPPLSTQNKMFSISIYQLQAQRYGKHQPFRAINSEQNSCRLFSFAVYVNVFLDMGVVYSTS